MADAPKTRPQPPGRPRKDSELIREFDNLMSRETRTLDDGEYVHTDWHSDSPTTPHQDYHVDIQGAREEHVDYNRHLDSDRPREGFGDVPSPGPHQDVRADHLDVWYHTDLPKGEHVDIQYHVDDPAGGHDDYHSDWKQGHLDKPGGGFIDV